MVEEKDIEPHVPVWDKTERKDDSFSISDFPWNKDAEEYRCPAGKALHSEWRIFKSLRSHVTKANNHQLPIQPNRQRDMFDESQVLPEHCGS
jgi:hypothetical protein